MNRKQAEKYMEFVDQLYDRCWQHIRNHEFEDHSKLLASDLKSLAAAIQHLRYEIEPEDDY